MSELPSLGQPPEVDVSYGLDRCGEVPILGSFELRRCHQRFLAVEMETASLQLCVVSTPSASSFCSPVYSPFSSPARQRRRPLPRQGEEGEEEEEVEAEEEGVPNR